MRIIDVQKNSIGAELGIAAGDELLSFDGNEVSDILDYDFYNDGESFVMSVYRDGEIFDYEIEKDTEEDLGLVLDGELKVGVCRNKCIFCFVDQLPKKELRNTLRVKDDDYRLSFISGSYVTLTNVSQKDLERIVRLRLSPLYVSIHSCNNELRRVMLGNPKAPDIIAQLEYLHSNGIGIHAQIVYCPDVNEDIAESIAIASRYCKSLAIVPVGLTKDCNSRLRAVNGDDARKIIQIVEKCQEDFLKELGTRFVFLADEFYIKAGSPVPHYESYEDFVQIENGVGLTALFRHDFDEALKEADIACDKVRSIATGEDAYPFIKEAADKLSAKTGGKINVYAIRNEFFGPSVTVAGLVTGGDIYNQLCGKEIGSCLILPRCMFKEFHDVFLDNMTVDELSKKLGVSVKIIDTDGYSFVKGCAEI